MQHLDKLIPLFVLIGVGGFLYYLLRLANAERVAAVGPDVHVWPVKPETSAPPLKEEKPALLVVAPVAAPIVTPVVKEEITLAKTPVHNVLDLLQSKDALTTAFLLKEILGPPVSRRQ